MPIRVAGGLSALNQKIGAYSLISLIGQGGMSSVWLAERSDGRLPASRGAQVPAVCHDLSVPAERFKREGKILGQLTHPNISKTATGCLRLSSPMENHISFSNMSKAYLSINIVTKKKLNLEARIQLFLM